MSRKTLGISLGVLVAFVGGGAYVLTPGRTPATQPPLAAIGADTLSLLQSEFNRSADTKRVVLLLSPTCPTCLQGASAVQKILEDQSQGAVTVFAVWEPMLPTDWSPPGRLALHRLGDARVRQFWDPQHVVATSLKNAGKGWHRQPECCELRGVLWDLAVVFAPGQRWDDQLPEPTFIEGTIVGASPALATALASR